MAGFLDRAREQVQRALSEDKGEEVPEVQEAPHTHVSRHGDSFLNHAP